jgi:hypothetical protein
MNEIRIPAGPVTRFSEQVRDPMALGIWFAVLAGVIFLSSGQSTSMTAGLMLQLTGAYSTFVVCAKAERSLLVHAVPYAFALAGAAFLCLAPDFRNAPQASLAFLVVTAVMHASVVYRQRKNPGSGDAVCAGVG